MQAPRDSGGVFGDHLRAAVGAWENTPAESPMISVVVPACNEEKHLSATLAAIQAASRRGSRRVELIVVDNASTDSTAAVAVGCGAKVVHEPIRSVARARNAGAAAATGDLLLFIDADTLVPESLLEHLERVMGDRVCVGGAVDVRHTSKRRAVRIYLAFWRLVGVACGMAQGAAQFCRRDVFLELRGYDESLWMGEDVEIYWRLKRLARLRRSEAPLIKDVRVVPSPRRFDQWPLWKIFLYTNPVFAAVCRRRRAAWKGWYDELVR